MALLTLSEQNTIKAISQNWANKVKVGAGVKNFEQLESEIENVKYKKMIGAALLYDIQQNSTNPEYLKLLNGDTFLNCHNNPVEFKGIKYQLAYILYAKYIGISDQEDTFTGMVRQNRTETSPLSEGSIKREQRDAEEAAQTDFELMREYVIKNISLYPKCEYARQNTIFMPKLTTIRKTYK